ncbi:MAG TPA: hypothetical protein VLY23_07010 [Candidatus Acidoferrum sp.]|nr:hypothetical protein [Candidatus Acidoferrum sp.]
MLRKILIGLAIFLLFLVSAAAYIYHKIQPSIREAEKLAEAENKMLTPRMVAGGGRFERRAFYTGSGIGDISQILVGWPADREGTEIAVVGSQGADFVDSVGQLKKQVRFAIQQHCPVAVARLDSTGAYGFLTREESWAVPATLFNNEGQVSWRSTGNWLGVDDSTSGDISGDGKLSVVVGLNGGGGITLLDAQGKQIWTKKETNVWHVEMLDTSGDGREEIVHSNARGQLLVRNGAGEVVARYLPDFYVSHFALTRWGDESRPSHILVPVSERRDGCCKPYVIVSDRTGKKLAELESPMGDLFDRFNATPIRFGNGTEYFAVLEDNSPRERSMLLLYGPDGSIAYQEILGESCLGMAALHTKDGERLLIGCAARIFAYSPALPTVTAPEK